MSTSITKVHDLLMTFPQETAQETIEWVVTRIQNRAPSLIVDVMYHQYSKKYGFYFTTDYETLLKGAEELCVRKPIKNEFGGGKSEFVFEDQDSFINSTNCNSFLSSQERQNIVKHIIYNVRANDHDMLGRIQFLEKEPLIPKLMSKGVIETLMPLHQRKEISCLKNLWVTTPFRPQPLEKVEDYFGVKIAMYFAYLGHYTVSLIIPALLGLLLWVIATIKTTSSDHLLVIFAFVNIVWATLYLESWKRASAGYAYQWGVDVENELIAEPRPLYHGITIKSKVTGKLEPWYPNWKRNLFRCIVSIPVSVICFGISFYVLTNILDLKFWIIEEVNNGNLYFLFNVLPNVLMALAIGILDDLHKYVAYWLNDKENFRLEETYHNNLLVKILVFKSVNSFLALFYVAFYLQDLYLLRDNLSGIFITKQIMSHMKEAILPFLKQKAKLMWKCPNAYKCDISQNETGGLTCIPDSQSLKKYFTNVRIDHSDKDLPNVTQTEIELDKIKYESTLEDHLEICIQFGYVTFFSSVFPLAALCALLNNIFEIRTDAFKLCTIMRRPFGERVPNIGNWQYALEFMGIVAVTINCIIIGMSNFVQDLFPESSLSDRILIIVALEHLVIAFKVLLAYAIPDLPSWIDEEKACIEFMKKEALKKSKRLIKKSKSD